MLTSRFVRLCACALVSVDLLAACDPADEVEVIEIDGVLIPPDQDASGEALVRPAVFAGDDPPPPIPYTDSPIPLVHDFLGDGIDDPTIWNPPSGKWNMRTSGPNHELYARWLGQGADIPIVGDYSGDGVDEEAIWRPSTGQWFIWQPGQTGPGTVHGAQGDKPVAGDFNGDGRQDFVVWRPSNGTWYARDANGPWSSANQWGQVGDIPLVGDFDGDGRSDPAVFRPSTLHTYVRQWNGAYFLDVAYGSPWERPLAGDIDGDGVTDVVMWSTTNGTWRTRVTGAAADPPSRQWGDPGDVPLLGDWNGDGKDDYTVYRPATGYWYGIDAYSGVQILGTNAFQAGCCVSWL